MVDIVLKAILLLSPICYTTGFDLERFNVLFFYCAVMALVGASFIDKPKRHYNCPVMGIFLIFLILQLFWHNFDGAITSATLKICLSLIGIRIIALYASRSDVFLKYMVWGGLVNIFVLALQNIGYNPIFNLPCYGEIGGMMGSGPRLATYLTLTLPFAIKVNPLLALLYVVVCLSLKEVTILFLLIFMIFLRIKRASHIGSGIFLVITGISGFLLFKDQIVQSLNIRWLVWEPTIMMIFNSPQQGYGIGIFPFVSSQFIKGAVYADNVFSSLIQFIFAVGLPGFLFIGWFMRDFIKNIRFDHETIAMIALMVLMVVEYPFEIPRMWPTIMAVIGFYLITKKEKMKWIH